MLISNPLHSLLLSCLLLPQEVERPGGPAPVGSEAASPVEKASDAPRILTEGTHQRLVFENDVTRVAVGRSQTMSVEILNSRELLVLGQKAGRTSLFVWFANGSTETHFFSVEPDLSFLRQAMTDIHPSISVELAPHHDAVVLRGRVPDVSYRNAAESAASAFLDSRRRKVDPTPLVSASSDEESGEAEEVRAPEELKGAAVINLIRLDELPALADEKIREALVPLEGTSISVRRVSRGDLPNDEVDLFVLEGTVPDQVTLTRALFLASRALLGEAASGQDDIKVLADEGGALTDVEDLFGATEGGQNQGDFSLGSVTGRSGGRSSQLLSNRIGANLGRAKVIEAAAGRILAMISVENLPLVRVDVRLYEVNLSRLRQWQNDLAVQYSDFDQAPLQPSAVSTGLQGGDAPVIGQDDIQNVLGFLGGAIGNQTQLVTGGLAIENVFNLLVNQQVARALSRPTLTVLSGELALFQVGGQVPIPIAVTIGGGTDQVFNGVEFRDFGIQLAVRPLVEELDAETITLDLAPIVSLPDFDLTAAIGAVTGSAPGTTAFETRGTRTHTRLRDGEAMLVGGLISQRQLTGQAKTPGLGDMPMAGWLFRNEAEDAEELELVIVVNPVIVRSERHDARLWTFLEPADVLAECLEEVRSAPQEDASTEEGDPEADQTAMANSPDMQTSPTMETNE